MKNHRPEIPPRVYVLNKPARISSQDYLRQFKRFVPKTFGKIGHFGTLDPFASGLFLVGVAGAARLNDYIHADLSKTYLAIGKLGIETDSGDYTGKVQQKDETSYLKTVIKNFSSSFIQEQMNSTFVGDYWQAPPFFSAAKFEGRPLHEWAREGQFIQKEQVKRMIFKNVVVKYQFPYLILRFEVSSGTYIRTLFQDIAKHLGTVGTLVALQREKIGHLDLRHAFRLINWDTNKLEKFSSVDQVLPYPKIQLTKIEVEKIQLGNFLAPCHEKDLVWLYDQDNVIALGKHSEGRLRPIINFHNVLS